MYLLQTHREIQALKDAGGATVLGEACYMIILTPANKLLVMGLEIIWVTVQSVIRTFQSLALRAIRLRYLGPDLARKKK
jgi:hypothetical protein